MTFLVKFRQKVLAVRKREGLSFQDVADRFDVGVASVVRWDKTIEPKNTSAVNREKLTLRSWLLM